MMNLKDIICKEYGYNEVIPYQLKIIAMRRISIFLPISFECIDNQSIRLCYDVTEMDRVSGIKDGGEAPYIAYSLISGMREAMDYYIFPSQYLIKSRLLFIGKDRQYRLAYVPEVKGEVPIYDPAKLMRKKTFSILRDIYFGRNYSKNNETKNIDNYHILEELLSVLLDNTIGMDTCIRRIDKLKEKTNGLNDMLIASDKKHNYSFSKIARLDLSRKFI